LAFALNVSGRCQEVIMEIVNNMANIKNKNLWSKRLVRAREIMKARKEFNYYRELNRETIDYQNEFDRLIDCFKNFNL
jgi:hypothetical protein